MKFIDKNYRTIKSKSGRAIAGLSMGGFHSLHISKAEKDDVRTQQCPVGRRGVELLLPALDRDDQIGIARRAQAGPKKKTSVCGQKWKQSPHISLKLLLS